MSYPNGRLAKEPELKFYSSERGPFAVLRFTLAKDVLHGKTKQKIATTWMDCKVLGQRAEALHERLKGKKGKLFTLTAAEYRKTAYEKDGRKRYEHYFQVYELQEGYFDPRKEIEKLQVKVDHGHGREVALEVQLRESNEKLNEVLKRARTLEQELENTRAQLERPNKELAEARAQITLLGNTLRESKAELREAERAQQRVRDLERQLASRRSGKEGRDPLLADLSIEAESSIYLRPGERAALSQLDSARASVIQDALMSRVEDGVSVADESLGDRDLSGSEYRAAFDLGEIDR